MNPFAVVSQGPIRDGQNVPYASVAPQVREAIALDGVVEPRTLVARGLALEGVNGALRRGVRSGEIVQVFRGVYARPDVAAAIRRAVRQTTGKELP